MTINITAITTSGSPITTQVSGWEQAKESVQHMMQRDGGIVRVFATNATEGSRETGAGAIVEEWTAEQFVRHTRVDRYGSLSKATWVNPGWNPSKQEVDEAVRGANEFMNNSHFQNFPEFPKLELIKERCIGMDGEEL